MSDMADLSKDEVRSAIDRIQFALIFIKSWDATQHLQDALNILSEGLKDKAWLDQPSVGREKLGD